MAKLWLCAADTSLLFILKARNPWFARSALSSASTACAHAELVA